MIAVIVRINDRTEAAGWLLPSGAIALVLDPATSSAELSYTCPQYREANGQHYAVGCTEGAGVGQYRRTGLA
jgi:hypothetical protein